MRNAIVRMPEQQVRRDSISVLREAVRQVDRAGLYLAAVAHMEIGDRAAMQSLNQLRTDLDLLRRHLARLEARD
jgi:hypothetical protein